MLNNDPSNLSKPGAYRAEALEVFGGVNPPSTLCKTLIFTS